MGILSTPKDASDTSMGIFNLYTMNRKVWTQEDVEILTRMYPDHFAQEIAGLLGRKIPSIYNKAAMLGLKCNPEKIRRAGKMSCCNPKNIATRFTKGHIPVNKGKKMSPEVYARCAGTMFKVGNTPHNHKEIGSERITKDGYIQIKVAEPNKWRMKHRVIWEQHNGVIPPGCNIQFRNHNSQDCRIENLYLITRVDQIVNENSLIAKYPKELQDVMRLRGAVKRMINQKQQNGK